MLEAFRFSSRKLFHLCTSHARSGSSSPISDSKQQLEYLKEYLSELRCKSIVVESPYTDRDYLHDFASYYALCHRDYPRRCSRLHFFAPQVTDSTIRGLLEGDPDIRSLLARQGSYLGFVVIKPLPDAFIGRTCLAHYPPDGDRRRYNSVRRYEVNLAGLQLSVKSLAFQEQDTVIAACATTAIWSALHKTSQLFSHSLPTPTEITRFATAHGSQHGRVLPSQGLELGQMCRALLSAGLETELRDGSRLKDIRPFVYAYNSRDIGLPVILGLEKQSAPSSSLRHAVTVAGFSLPSRAVGSANNGSTVAESINELYVHDDQTGPFARARVLSARSIQLANERYRVFAAVVPVYPKIRVRYEAALDETLIIDPLLRPFAQYQWDIQLSTGTALQQYYATSSAVPLRLRHKVLSHDWPRFVWRSQALSGSALLLDLIIDATDIERSFPVLELLIPHQQFAEHLQVNLFGATGERPRQDYLAGLRHEHDWRRLFRSALA